MSKGSAGAAGAVIFLMLILLYFAIEAFFVVIAIGALALLYVFRKKEPDEPETVPQNKEDIDAILKTPFKECAIKDGQVDEEAIAKKFGLEALGSYEDFFDDEIKFRGGLYYKRHKVTKMHKRGNKVTCIAHGEKDYDVEITYNDNGFEATCTCPHHAKTKKNCKHIYAAMLMSQYKNNLNELIDETERHIDAIRQGLYHADKYIDRHDFSDEDVKKFSELQKTVEAKVHRCSINCGCCCEPEPIVGALKDAIELKTYFINEMKPILDREILKTVEPEETEIEWVSSNSGSSSSSRRASGSSSGSILLDWLVADAAASQRPKGRYSENELDGWGLSREEKAIVRTGDYDPWDMDEENMDEESWYNDRY